MTSYGLRERKARLGKKLKTLFGKKIVLAPNALYVDFSKKPKVNKHRYFMASGQEGNPYFKEYFTAVLSGDPFKFDGYGEKWIKWCNETAQRFIISRNGENQGRGGK